MILQIFVSMVVMDTWQYFAHRLMHANKFLYKHVHSKHHELVVPYAFGAIYCHFVEGIILDTGGAFLCVFFSGMTPLTGAIFFSFSFIKTIDDHSSLWLPTNIFPFVFQNTGAFHELHHQPYGKKYNFSTPFFVTWDKLLGTYLDHTLEKRKDGGVVVRPVLKGKKY
ncbi:sphinganine C4-monooxygenase 1-like [Phalaenopsis equestris]|uniref:sphinganine C4-monooxygenase 1-like n=1 Tax=Phalaenopsis equestris TaxID=78828 RepID=UPI0009E1C955|nr:sphinganine C4-monooxygenase 1-like [Phalaenopsis equestris]